MNENKHLSDEDKRKYATILGISIENIDDKKTIDAKYRRLAKHYHPDKNSEKTTTEKERLVEKFKELNIAYHELIERINEHKKSTNMNQTEEMGATNAMPTAPKRNIIPIKITIEVSLFMSEIQFILEKIPRDLKPAIQEATGLLKYIPTAEKMTIFLKYFDELTKKTPFSYYLREVKIINKKLPDSIQDKAHPLGVNLKNLSEYLEKMDNSQFTNQIGDQYAWIIFEITKFLVSCTQEELQVGKEVTTLLPNVLVEKMKNTNTPPKELEEKISQLKKKLAETIPAFKREQEYEERQKKHSQNKP